MCGRAYEPRFLFSWPVSRCSVMGPDQLTGVMTQVAIQSALAYVLLMSILTCRAGKEIDQGALDRKSEGFRKNVHLQSTAYYTSSHVLDDGVIDPRDTRDVLGMCLEIVSENGIKGNSGFGGVSRL
jgi:acetyl-CoA carboxylase carboxyltransferase component